MKYLSVKEFSEKWNITERRVQHLCKDGLIHGAEKSGRSWRIPEDTERPRDNRTREAKNSKKHHIPMPRKTPFLDMSDLYHTPGKADECAEALSTHPEAQMLFRAEIEYSRGNVDEVLIKAKQILDSHTGFYAVIGGGMLLALAAMWKGDVDLWYKAKKHILEVPCYTSRDREIVSLALASTNSAVYDTTDFPEWFKIGDFEPLPADALPAARVYYVKYLLLSAKALALKKTEQEGEWGFGFMRMLPYVVRPMISQVVSDKTVIPELYLRLSCAISYHYSGEDGKAVEQIDRAVDLALPDMLLGTLAEHRRSLDTLLDDRLKLRDPAAFKKYKALHRRLSEGWTAIHSAVFEKEAHTALSTREREAARLASFGFSNSEIAEKMKISIPSVKSLIFYAMNKTGVQKRSELGLYV